MFATEQRRPWRHHDASSEPGQVEQGFRYSSPTMLALQGEGLRETLPQGQAQAQRW
jgi:hypothetical protein